ncbi:MAG: tRNA 2-thiouridine(34) synthase MnmA [Candidatus Paceibacterota bacterium]|jgi:tRNA-specific 2-thiouridylase
MGLKKKVKIFVGMSGGVDSSVSAALLANIKNARDFKKVTGREAPSHFDGVEVFGVFIKVWSPDWMPCTWPVERRDAMRVAACLKIPLITLDLEKEYKRDVVDYMIREYRDGRVPNPDVMCNKTIKFGQFLKWAIKNGADYVATGHYAQTVCDGQNKICRLLSGVDKEKDQSYFLWTLGQKELVRTIFPVGGMEKSDVRKIAHKFSLPNAAKKDSQGVCFLGKINIKDFLKHYIKEKPGNVLNDHGEIIGKHEGATLYTIGERHGFEITKNNPDGSPFYVVGKDTNKNVLVVSNRKSGGEFSKKELKISSTNWNQGIEPNLKQNFCARIRYRQELQDCKIKKVKLGLYNVVFKDKQIAITPGQSVVVYTKNNDECLGGGIIV